MRRSKLFLSLIAALMVLVMAGCGGSSGGSNGGGGSAPATQPDYGLIQKGVLKIGTDTTFKPFEYVDEKGNLAGFDVELGQEIAKELGLKVDWSQQSFRGLLPALTAGQLDMVIAFVYITEERAEAVDFSNPYLDTGGIMAVRDDDDSITKPEDLAGKKVGMKTGTAYAKLAEDLKEGKVPSVELVEFRETIEAFQALRNKQVDAVFNDEANTLFYIKENPGVAKIVGDRMSMAEVGLAVRKGNSGLQRAVNEALEKIKADGRHEQLRIKYLGK